MQKVKESLVPIFQYIWTHIFMISPLFVMALFLFLTKTHDLYPYGEQSMAWADVQQQVIPLLNTFKDILSGQTSLVYTFNHAGGMTFFGVFFFFLASPFTFLVAFIDKSDMMSFINILIMLKMMVAGATLGFYLHKKYPNLHPFISVAFSLLYAFSAYNLMYYQNVIWIDCMALFPLLFLSIEHLFEKDNILPYLVMMTLAMVINYYIGMIEVIFILMFVSLWLYYRKKEEDIKKKAWHFFLASGIAALLTMVVLFPSLLQYLSSARSSSLIESIENSWFFASYETTVPLLLGLVFLFPFMRGSKLSPLRKVKMISLILLCIPLLVDPINKVWHFGSYQAFPSRFFFINLFLVLDLTAETLSEEIEEDIHAKHGLSLVLTFGLIILLFRFEQKYVADKLGDLDQYASTLWGNLTSFEALLRYYIVVLIIALIIYFLYKTKLLHKNGLAIAIFSFSVIEAMFAFNIYVAPASRSSYAYEQYYQLENVIEDDSFYRVKTTQKMQHVNDLGAMGYANLGHYTSLTNEKFMFTMKKLGYSSYWMEIGAYGGTTFTDALMANKYTIYSGQNPSAAYQVAGYHIMENPVFPLGIVTHTNLAHHKELEEDTRVHMQETLYQALIDDMATLHTTYDYTSLNGVVDLSTDSRYKYTVSTSGSIFYNIDILGKQSLYFECFDAYSNRLKEPINQSMRIYVDGRLMFNGLYPEQLNNGTVSLGTYEDETVSVRLDLVKSIEAKSFSLFSINETKLLTDISTISHADMVMDNGQFSGTYEASDDSQYLFLPFAYSDGIKATINRKSVDVIQVFSGFSAIKLLEGTNEIRVFFTVPGFVIGVSLSLLGASLLGLYLYLKYRKRVISKSTIHTLSYYTILFVGGALFTIIYIVSIFINVFGQLT